MSLQSDILILLDKHQASVQDIFRAMYEVINYPAEFIKKKHLKSEKSPAVCELKPNNREVKPNNKQPLIINDNEVCAS